MPKIKIPKFVLFGAKVLVLLTIGFLLGKFYSVPVFEVDTKISLVDILSILATLIAAYWVSTVLDKKKQDGRVEKDLFLKRSDDIVAVVQVFYVKVSSSVIPLGDVVSNCKALNMSISSLYAVLKTRQFPCDAVHETYIFHSVRQINILLTNTPLNSSGDVKPGISIVNGVVYLQPSRLALVEQEFERLKNFLLQLQLEINNA